MSLDQAAILLSQGFQGFKLNNTRRLRAGAARVRSGTGNLTIACCGDSTTVGEGANSSTYGLTDARRYAAPRSLASILNKRWATAREASIWGVGQPNVPYQTYHPQVTPGAGWGADSRTSLGGWMFVNTTTTNPLSYAPTEAFDTVHVLYARMSGGGTFNIGIDESASVGTVNSDAAASVQIATVQTTLAEHVITIARTGVGSGVSIIGVVAYDSTLPQAQVWNMGWNGARAADWGNASDPWSPSNAITTVAPDVTLFNIGINNWTVGTSAADFERDYQAFVDHAKAVSDVVLIVPVPSSYVRATAEQQAVISQAIYRLAALNDLPLIDLSVSFGSYAQANTDGLMYDALHPNKVGYAHAASLMANAIMNACA